MHRSPSVAAITCFWPDHVELHGSLERYRAAKEAIVRGQFARDAVVANEDDDGSVSIAAASAGRRFGFSAAREVVEGAFVREESIVLREGGGEQGMPLPPDLDMPRLQALLAASAAALAAGRPPTRVEPLQLPERRMTVVGRRDGAELVDDCMAATPAKTAAALRPRPDESLVLVAGGEIVSAGLPVHAAPEEQRLLEDACAEARRAARLVVLFGPAADRLAPLLDPARTRTEESVERAIAQAGDCLSGAETLVVSPMFPVSLEARERIARALRSLVR
jgi:UDP-N-acetylmuramoylalanine--D-glutamate ligase